MDECAEYLVANRQVPSENGGQSQEEGPLGEQGTVGRRVGGLDRSRPRREERDGDEKCRQDHAVLLGAYSECVRGRHQSYTPPLRSPGPEVCQDPQEDEERHEGVASSHPVRYGFGVHGVDREQRPAHEGQEGGGTQHRQEPGDQRRVDRVESHVEGMEREGITVAIGPAHRVAQ